MVTTSRCHSLSICFHAGVFPGARPRNPQISLRTVRDSLCGPSATFSAELSATGRRFALDRAAGYAGRAADDPAGTIVGLYPRHLLPRKDRGRISPEEAATLMRHYEIMIILDPNLEERTVQPSLDQFLKVVTGGGGKVEKVDIWGKRRLAYQIEKKPEGIYAVVDLTAEPAAVQELDRQLTLNEAILRTTGTRPEPPPSAAPFPPPCPTSSPIFASDPEYHHGSGRHADHDRGQPRG